MLLSTSCNVKKRLPQGAKLYNGHSIEFLNKGNIEHAARLKGELDGMVRPKANKKFLGLFRTRLWFYLVTNEPKKKKGLRRFFKYKIGEPPVYLETSLAGRNVKLLRNALYEEGYFNNTLDYKIIQGNKTVEVKYEIATVGRYHIKEVFLPEDSSSVSGIIRFNEDELDIKRNDPYSIDAINKDRTNITNLVRNYGYYDFNEDYLYFYVDTTAGGLKADLYYRVKQPTDSTEHQRYYLRNVKVFPVHSIDDEFEGKNDTTKLENYTFISPQRYVRPKVLKRAMLYDAGENYSQKQHQYTLNHLLDLGTFKFVNINYKKVTDDSLDIVAYLTPGQTQNITAEVNASTTTTNFLGTSLSFRYNNRNLFRGAEELRLSATAAVETQIGVESQSFINTLQLTGEAELIFPRFLLPIKVNASTYFIPRTKIGLSNNYEQRLQFFTLNSFGGEFGYMWHETRQKQHEVTALGINRVRTLSTTGQFDEILKRNPFLRSSFSDVMIINMMYSYTYNNAEPNNPYKNYIYFKGTGDFGGNLSYAMARAIKPKGERPYSLTGLPFAQYTKFDVDTRYYVIANKKTSWATRVQAGVVIPYGNSSVTPYIKQFFGGGSTDLRAYRFRTLGPGSYNGETTDEGYPDRTGDIKMALSTELRHTLYKFLKGAFFVDAGNVWLLKEDTTRRGSSFTNDFYREFAVGIGYGLRVDFNFFVIRLDVAIPIRKPELPQGDRWAFDEMEWRNKGWRQDNIIYNIAIGYPF